MAESEWETEADNNITWWCAATKPNDIFDSISYSCYYYSPYIVQQRYISCPLCVSGLVGGGGLLSTALQ